MAYRVELLHYQTCDTTAFRLQLAVTIKKRFQNWSAQLMTQSLEDIATRKEPMIQYFRVARQLYALLCLTDEVHAAFAIAIHVSRSDSVHYSKLITIQLNKLNLCIQSIFCEKYAKMVSSFPSVRWNYIYCLTSAALCS